VTRAAELHLLGAVQDLDVREQHRGARRNEEPEQADLRPDIAADQRIAG
jgi:hypothetical protein